MFEGRGGERARHMDVPKLNGCQDAGEDDGKGKHTGRKRDVCERLCQNYVAVYSPVNYWCGLRVRKAAKWEGRQGGGWRWARTSLSISNAVL